MRRTTTSSKSVAQASPPALFIAPRYEDAGGTPALRPRRSQSRANAPGPTISPFPSPLHPSYFVLHTSLAPLGPPISDWHSCLLSALCVSVVKNIPSSLHFPSVRSVPSVVKTLFPIHPSSFVLRPSSFKLPPSSHPAPNFRYPSPTQLRQPNPRQPQDHAQTRLERNTTTRHPILPGVGGTRRAAGSLQGLVGYMHSHGGL